MATPDDEAWKVCSSCKSPIGFGERYYACSVSTCNRSRTALYFCSVACWDAHNAMARHRDGAAIEKRAPTRQAWAREQEAAESKSGGRSSGASSSSDDDAPVGSGEVDTSEVLIVASKLKDYVEARAQMRVSQQALYALSHLVRRECDQAIAVAREAGRKTVMDRDVLKPPAGTKQGDTLVVVSRTKNYIKARSGMNTSGSVADMLSAHIRGWTNEAIRKARQDERETLKGRDFEF